MAEYNYADLQMYKEVGTQDGVKGRDDDSDRWEMDVDNTLDRLYHSWLGEKQNNEGVWVRDRKLKRFMNETGASYLISVLYGHFNVNMQFSMLDQTEVSEILVSVWESVNDVLTKNYTHYELDVGMIKTVTSTIKNCLWMWLKIPFGGGMRNYKGDKTKTVINRQEVKHVEGAF